MKLIVLLFDEEKNVQNKESMPEWFNVCKNKLLRNVNELKSLLKARLIEEKISERQFRKIEPHYEREKFDNKNYFKDISGACEKLGGWIKAMRSIYLTNLKLEPIIIKQKDAQEKLNKGQDGLDKLINDFKDLEEKVNNLQKDEMETKQ